MDHLELVKDGNGRFWSLEYDFSNLDDLQPGKGYLVRMNRAMDLVYTLELDQANVLSKPSEVALVPPGVGGTNHSLLLKFEAPMGNGVVEAWDREGRLSGMVEVRAGETQAGLAVWGEEHPRDAGLAVGEALNLFWRTPDQEAAVPLKAAVLAGDQTWQINGFSVLAVKANTAALPAESCLLSANPNPFNSRVILYYSLNPPSSAKLKIFDTSGRLVFFKELHSSDAGSGRVIWDASGNPSGVYFARLDASAGGSNREHGLSSALKLLLVK